VIDLIRIQGTGPHLFAKHHTIEQSVAYMRELLGQDVEIYAIAYSLGSNHLLKHLGNHVGCKDVCGIKAAVSISGAFEVATASIHLS